MPDRKKLGLVFIPNFADWEYGLLAASAVEWFGAQAFSLTPDGQPVASTAGFRLMPDRSTVPDENEDLDAVAVIGSDQWTGATAPDVAPLLKSVARRGGVVGGICAGTLALARAGLFGEVAHTSNGRDWIASHLPDYAGSAHYRDVPHAVSGGRIVSAPGSAPGTFAIEFLTLLFPERLAEMGEMRALFAKEHANNS